MKRLLLSLLACIAFCVPACCPTPDGSYVKPAAAPTEKHVCAGHEPETSLRRIRIHCIVPCTMTSNTISLQKDEQQVFTVDGLDQWDCPTVLDYARVTWDVRDYERFPLRVVNGIAFVTAKADLFDTESLAVKPRARLVASYGKLSSEATLVGIVNISGAWSQEFVGGAYSSISLEHYGPFGDMKHLVFAQSGGDLLDGHNRNVIGTVSDSSVHVLLSHNFFVEVTLTSRTTATGTYKNTCLECPPMGTVIWTKR